MKKTIWLLFISFILLCTSGNILAVKGEEVDDDEFGGIELDNLEPKDEYYIKVYDNYIFFNRPNTIINDSSMDYFRELFQIEDEETLEIVDFSNNDIDYESNNYYFGTGMKFIFEVDNDYSTDTEEDDDENDEDNNENFNDIDNISPTITNPDITNPTTTTGDEDDSEIITYETDYNGKIYYIVVSGDITGDGRVEVNDITKAKTKKFTDFLKKDNLEEEEQVEQSLYKKALKIYEKKDDKYLDISEDMLAQTNVLNTNLDKIINKTEASTTITTNSVNIGGGDTYNIIDKKTNDLIFSSLDESIAVVDETGRITALKEGTTKITVKQLNYSDRDSKMVETALKEININIITAPRAISFLEKDIVMTINSKYKNEVYISPKDLILDDDEIKYSGNDENILKVNKDGSFEAISEGKTTVTVETFNGKKDTCNVIVVKESDVELSDLSITNKKGFVESNGVNNNEAVNAKVLVGSSFKIMATAKYKFNNNNAPIYYSSSDNKIGEIDPDGNVKIKDIGTVTFFAKSGTEKKSYKVSSYVASLGSNELNLSVDESVTVAISYTNSNGQKENFNDLDITTDNTSTYFSTDIHNNAITFTGVQYMGNKKTVSVIIDNLPIGKIIINEVKDPAKATNGTVYFIPVQLDGGSGNGEAIAIKSEDGSLALIDNGKEKWTVNNKTCEKGILNYLQKYTGVDANSPVTIQHMIISHSHGDHFGCLFRMLDEEKIKIENLWIKQEVIPSIIAYDGSWKRSKVNMDNRDKVGNKVRLSLYDYAKKYISHYNINTRLRKVSGDMDNSVIELGKGDSKKVKLHLHNITDIYENSKEKCMTISAGAGSNGIYDSGKITIKSKKIVIFNWFEEEVDPNIISIKRSDGTTVYPYIKNATDNEIQYSTKVKIGTLNSKGYGMYFYALNKGTKKVCDFNANSIAIMAEIPVGENDKRYAYITSDIANAGYPVTGKVATIHDEDVLITNAMGFYSVNNSTKKLDFNESGVVFKAQEYRTSYYISNHYDINKIFLYQPAHHSGDVTAETVRLLNLNRDISTNKDFYIVNSGFIIRKKTKRSSNSRTYQLVNNVVEAGHLYASGGGYLKDDGTVGRISGLESLYFEVLNDGEVKVHDPYPKE